MREINKIYIHCSASEFGDRDLIKKWHTDPPPNGKGWKDIGYHFVICNQYPHKDQKDNSFDGKIQKGRNLEEVGSHCLGDNQNSIGICLVGDKVFTPAQFINLYYLCIILMEKFNIKSENVWGHREFWTKQGKEPEKTCPNFDVESLRKELSKKDSITI